MFKETVRYSLTCGPNLLFQHVKDTIKPGNHFVSYLNV